MPQDDDISYPVIGFVVANNPPTLDQLQAAFFDWNELMYEINSLPGPFPHPIPPSFYALLNNNIVAYHGNPQDDQTCDGSKPIGDMLGYFNNGSGQVQEMAANVNAIQSSPKFSVTNPGNIAYATGVTNIGWLYKDQGGHYWIQSNAALLPQSSVSLNAQWLSFGITFTNDSSPKYIGTKPPALPAAETYGSCWPDSANNGRMG